MNAQIRKDLDERTVEKERIDFLERMMAARDEDIQAYKRGQPVLGKLEMLRELEQMTMKEQYRDALIDCGLLPIWRGSTRCRTVCCRRENPHVGTGNPLVDPGQQVAGRDAEEKAWSGEGR